MYIYIYIYTHIFVYIIHVSDWIIGCFSHLSFAAAPSLPHGKPLRPFACSAFVQVAQTGMGSWKEHGTHSIFAWMDESFCMMMMMMMMMMIVDVCMFGS